tara:strand:+ start:1308 stop:1415 length:108 start_codon:yes stop_codon:yes gene_type:complete
LDEVRLLWLLVAFCDVVPVEEKPEVVVMVFVQLWL